MRKITENALINGRTVADYETRCGSVEADGKKYVLINQATHDWDCRFTPPDEFYTAFAFLMGDLIFTDDLGINFANLYKIKWDLSTDCNPNDSDESNACDWDKPRDIQLSQFFLNIENGQMI